MLAAAYTAEPSLADAVTQIAEDGGLLLAAALRYRALNNLALDPQHIADAFAARRQPRGPDLPVAQLADGNLVVPAQVLVCEAIGLSGDTAHLGLLHEALESRDTRVRQAALHAIAALSDPQSLPLPARPHRGLFVGRTRSRMRSTATHPARKQLPPSSSASGRSKAACGST